LCMGDTQPRNHFEKSPSLHNIVDIDVGCLHGIALDAQHRVWSWGSHCFGQLGLGQSPDQLTAQLINVEPVRQISCGTYHNLLLLRNGSVLGFGYNHFGNLGLADTDNRLEPERIPELKNIQKIVCTTQSSYAIDVEQNVFVFGWNIYHQLCLGHQEVVLIPVANPKLAQKELHFGGCHVFIIETDGAVSAVGWNIDGQLGNGSTSELSRPAPVQLDFNAGRKFSLVKSARAVPMPLEEHQYIENLQ
jgi:alpha-tubulin suppressor-like RCC1 family protein